MQSFPIRWLVVGVLALSGCGGPPLAQKVGQRCRVDCRKNTESGDPNMLVEGRLQSVSDDWIVVRQIAPPHPSQDHYIPRDSILQVRFDLPGENQPQE